MAGPSTLNHHHLVIDVSEIHVHVAFTAVTLGQNRVPFRIMAYRVKSLWHNDAIWRHISASTFVKVMACCLTALSNHLNQCWLIVKRIVCHTHVGKCSWTESLDMCARQTLFKLLPHFPGANNSMMKWGQFHLLAMQVTTIYTCHGMTWLCAFFQPCWCAESTCTTQWIFHYLSIHVIIFTNDTPVSTNCLHAHNLRQYIVQRGLDWLKSLHISIFKPKRLCKHAKYSFSVQL